MRVVASAAIVAAAVLTAAALAPVSARAKEARVQEPTLPAAMRRSRSVGLPWKGRLQRGIKLAASDTIRHVPEYAAHDRFYGTWQLVQVLQRAAERVANKGPRVKLSIGEMSGQFGGDLPGHASHESGRDVDVGFYMLDAAGKSFDASSFAHFDARGRGLAPNLGLRFDTARNWDFLARLITDAETRVQYVFVSPWLRQLLLDEGARRGASTNVLARAANVLTRPSEKHLHGNHFHVRIYCGPEERPRCVDEGQFWPWYPGTPPLPVARK